MSLSVGLGLPAIDGGIVVDNLLEEIAEPVAEIPERVLPCPPPAVARGVPPDAGAKFWIVLTGVDFCGEIGRGSARPMGVGGGRLREGGREEEIGVGGGRDATDGRGRAFSAAVVEYEVEGTMDDRVEEVVEESPGR